MSAATLPLLIDWESLSFFFHSYQEAIKMRKWAKALDARARQPEFSHQDPHKGSRRELTPQSCPLISTQHT